MQADITLTGAAAQLSRGLLPEISKRLTQQFADCLQTNMAAQASSSEPAAVASSAPAAPVAPVAPVAGGATRPVGGIRLGLHALWAAIAGFFRSFFGGGPSKRDRSRRSTT
jgi:uncharacterized protein